MKIYVLNFAISFPSKLYSKLNDNNVSYKVYIYVY